MRIAFFSTKPFDRRSFLAAPSASKHEITFLEPRLTDESVPLAAGFDAVCAFVNDVLDRRVIEGLAKLNVKTILLRCAGFNNVDLEAVKEFGITVARVPAYSPHGVAEHTVALMMGLNRKTHRAYNRVREGNFALDGLLGFDMFGKTVGIIGTGKIGVCVANIIKGFGCEILAYDPYQSDAMIALGAKYVELDEIYAKADIITLHSPLTPQTYHVIDEVSVAKMKPGMMVINTSRGGLLDTPAVIEGLKSGQIGYLGIDVYEEEADLFFEDRSSTAIADDVFARLLTFPNVLITGHQAFFTDNALAQIAETTLGNATMVGDGVDCPNLVK